MVSIRHARLSEVKAIHILRRVAADDLTRRFGYGHWSRISLLNTLGRALYGGTLFVIETGRKVVGTFAIDTGKRGFYLHSMSVQVDRQGSGIGRLTMTEIEKLARSRGLKSLRFDAYEGAAGAGGFYRKCGYASTHRDISNGVAMEYFEKVLG